MEAYSASLDRSNERFDEMLAAASTFSLDPKLIKILFSFNEILHQRFNLNPDYRSIKRAMYGKSQTVLLSDSFDGGWAVCAEIAAVAQAYLQTKGTVSTYFSGAVLESKTKMFADQHTFIVVVHQGKTLIYDPANPIIEADANIYPSILITATNFEAEVNLGVKRFVKATDVLSARAYYYGVDDHTNIDPNTDFAD
jgi:hypothetical protein